MKIHDRTILGLTLLLLASTAVRSRAETTGGDFLTVAPGARGVALGEAFTAVADDAAGMFFNPAGPGFILSPELQVHYASRPGETYLNTLAYVQPAFYGTYGVALRYLSGSSMPRYRSGVRNGDFGFYDAAADLLYARRLSETIAGGISIRGIESSIDGRAARAVTGDAGLLFKSIDEGFSLGAAGQNLGGTLSGHPLPVTFRAGMAFKASLADDRSDLLFSLEGGRTGGEPPFYSAGIEYWFDDTVGLQTGYRYVNDERRMRSLGPLEPWRAGVSVRVKSLQLDYAFQPHDATGTSHRLTLSWRVFGWQTRWRKVPGEAQVEPSVFSPDGDGTKDNILIMPRVDAIKMVKRWNVTVEDLSRAPVRQLSGEGYLPQVITWDGRDESGRPVVEGRYAGRLTVEGDRNKRAQVEWKDMLVDLTPPAVSLQVPDEAFSPNGDGFEDGTTFYVSVSDFHGVDQWQLDVNNDRGKTVWSVKSSSSVPVAVSWDGRDDYYGKPVPGGEYAVALTAWDKAGNRGEAFRKLTVYIPPKIQVREVVKAVKVREESRGLVVNLSSQVLFNVGETKLAPYAHRMLDEVVTILNTYPENDVLIEGHTDATGGREVNLKISAERAWAVYGYLVEQGIAPARLKVEGHGESKPVASNGTEVGRAQNRRVDIVILKDGVPVEGYHD